MKKREEWGMEQWMAMDDGIGLGRGEMGRKREGSRYCCGLLGMLL